MTVKELHREAMKFNDLAIIAKKHNSTLSLKYFEKAFEFELKAFENFNSKSNVEPTRTVLIRSAANLAILAGYFIEAENLIKIGLKGNPPEELASELRELFIKTQQNINNNEYPTTEALASTNENTNRKITNYLNKKYTFNSVIRRFSNNLLGKKRYINFRANKYQRSAVVKRKASKIISKVY